MSVIELQLLIVGCQSVFGDGGHGFPAEVAHGIARL